MEPTVCQAPILHRRQYRATSREIQGTVFHPGTVFFMRFQKTVPDTVFFTTPRVFFTVFFTSAALNGTSCAGEQMGGLVRSSRSA